MNSPWWRKLFPKPRKVAKKKRPGSRVKPRIASLRLESLEDRVVPATLHWIGVDSDGATNPGLNGAYYNIAATQGLIDSTNSAWLGNAANNYMPAATAVLTGAIDFPDIAGHGFQDDQGTTYYNIPGNDNNVEARWTGLILIPGTGTTPVPISFQTGSDDGSTLYIDGSLVVNNNNFQGVTYVQNTVNLTPGLHNIDIEYYQGGGGAAMFAQWDPTGGSNFVDIPPSAFFLPSANWSDPNNWQEGVIPHNGDTVVFDSSVTGSGAYTAINNIPGLTLNGIVIKNTSSTAFVISGDAVTIDNTDPTLTSGISDASTMTSLLSLTSIALGANTNIDNTSAYSTNTTPSFIISSNIDLAGHVLSSGPSFADADASTPDTGWSEIDGVISSSVANTDAIVESGYGVMALAGNNTYDGTTFVFNGVLVAAANNALGSTTGGAKTVNPNANPLPGNPGAALGVADGGDNAAYTNGVTLEGAGPSAIGGALWNADTNTNVFNAPIKLAGATTFEINNGGSLSLGGSLNIAANALTIAGNQNLTIGGVITGSASSSITDNNSATTTLTNNNAPFLGPLNINQGILAAAANNALGVGTGAVTVADGAALGFTNNVNYTTAQPVTITGSGPGGNGAALGIGGTDTFAGPVTVSSGDEYLGATAGQLSLGASVDLTGGNLVLVDNGGDLLLSGAISGPTTSTISKTGTGTATLSADNSGFQGATTVSAGLLALAANNALGDGVHSTVQVLDGGGLGFSGGINYSTPQAVSIIGSGSAGNGAVENVSGTNSFAGPITLNLGGDATVGADSGTALILSGNIDLFAQTLTVTGAGNTTITGVISGTGSSTVNNVLSGAYYSNVPGGMDTPVLDPTDARWLGNDTPTVSELLAVPIDLPNIDQNSFTQALTSGNAAGPNVGGQQVGVLWTGQITIPATAGGGGTDPVPITFFTGSDDGSRIWIDGTAVANLVVDNDANQGVTYRAGQISLVPGSTHTITIGYYQGGGGAGMFAEWDLTGSNFPFSASGNAPGGAATFIPASAFSILTPGSALVKTGSGTLTLSSNNSYGGTTTVDAGTVVAANDNAFGSPTGGGVTVNNGGDLALPAAGGITLPATKPITINGAGPAGNGAIENLGGANTVAGPIQLASNAAIGADGGTLTVSGQLSSSAGTTLAKEQTGTLILSGANSGLGGAVQIDAGVLQITNADALGSTAAGTTVASSAELQVQNVNGSFAEPITINGPGPANDGALLIAAGNTTWSGTVTLGSNAFLGTAPGASLEITGQVTDQGDGYGVTTVRRRRDHLRFHQYLLRPDRRQCRDPGGQRQPDRHDRNGGQRGQPARHGQRVRDRGLQRRARRARRRRGHPGYQQRGAGQRLHLYHGPGRHVHRPVRQPRRQFRRLGRPQQQRRGGRCLADHRAAQRFRAGRGRVVHHYQ